MTDPQDRLAFWIFLALMGALIAGAVWLGNRAPLDWLPWLQAAAALLGFVPFFVSRPIAGWILRRLLSKCE